MVHRVPANTNDTVLRCARIERSFGGLKALKGVTLDVRRGEIFGLVGPNGSGKTTMVNVVTGFDPPNAGSVALFGKDITGLAPHAVARRGVARTFQNLALFRGMSVLDNILLGRHVHMRPSALASLFRGTGSRARRGATTPHPRRADGRHESGGKGIHRTFHPGRPRGAGRYDPDYRASYGCGHRDLRSN